MYGAAYSLLMRLQPGKRLSEAHRNELAEQFARDEELIRLIGYSVYKSDRSSIADMWRELRDDYVDSEAEFMSFLRENDFPMTLEEAEAVDRSNLEAGGDVLLSVDLPRSRGHAAEVYKKLVVFCRQNDLCLDREDLENAGELPSDWDEFFAGSIPPSLPGFFISFTATEQAQHFVGGKNHWNGGQCPNCCKPLILHLTLDTADERLGLRELGVRQLPLLFCMRCNLGYDDDFVYRVVDDTSIELVHYAEDCDEGYSRDWNKAVGLDQFPKQPISLLPISSRVQELLDVLNRWFPAPPDKMTDSETAELKSLLALYSSASMPRAPNFVTNQVGGRPYLPQSLMFPDCPYCDQQLGKKKRMDVIANLTNDERNGFVVSFPIVYITFFLCTDCRTVHVEHRL